MIKQIIKRGLLGFPLGIALGYVITIIISICTDDGSFYPVTPELASSVGSTINAVMLQTILCGLMGTGFAAASVIWEIGQWSLAKQSGIYFAVISVVILPIAYIANWMKHTVTGFLSYFGIFVAIFILVWLIQYCIWKGRVKRINEGIRNNTDVK